MVLLASDRTKELSPTPIGSLIDRKVEGMFYGKATEAVGKLIEHYIEIARAHFSEEEFVIFSTNINYLFGVEDSSVGAAAVPVVEDSTDEQISFLKEMIYKIINYLLRVI